MKYFNSRTDPKIDARDLLYRCKSSFVAPFWYFIFSSRSFWGTTSGVPQSWTKIWLQWFWNSKTTSSDVGGKWFRFLFQSNYRFATRKIFSALIVIIGSKFSHYETIDVISDANNNLINLGGHQSGLCWVPNPLSSGDDQKCGRLHLRQCHHRPWSHEQLVSCRKYFNFLKKE